MLLTCPTCRSGLEVPDGTTALVRCPTCKGVFSPDAGVTEVEVVAPPPAARRAPPPARRPDPADRPRRTPDARDRDREDDPPARDRGGRRPRAGVNGLSERQAARWRRLKPAFDRASWGARLIWVSLLLYITSVMCLVLFFMLTATPAGARPELITLAGVMGLKNWLIGAFGLALAMTAPRTPGLIGYGVTAAVAVVAHGVAMVALFGQTAAFTEFLRDEGLTEGGSGIVWWAQLPTKFMSLTSYLSWLVYSDRVAAHALPGLHVFAGVAELLRLIFTVLVLSCLARAAGDGELVHRCVRGAAVVTIVPGLMILGMLGFNVLMVETNFQHTTAGQVLATVTAMASYVIVGVMLLQPAACARDVADACAEPIFTEE